MTGKQYADLIAAYLAKNFTDRGIKIFREVHVGTSVIGKSRKIDILVVHGDKALGVECKYQETQGTTDEKIPYSLQDVGAMWMPAVVAYAGRGWSTGVIHMLQSSEYACACLPDAASLSRTTDTRELDHILASVFGWWDLLVDRKKEFRLEDWEPPTVDVESND